MYVTPIRFLGEEEILDDDNTESYEIKPFTTTTLSMRCLFRPGCPRLLACIYTRQGLLTQVLYKTNG